MIINGKTLLELSPLSPMADTKHKEHGVSWGLSEVGYDIRIKQSIAFKKDQFMSGWKWIVSKNDDTPELGRFTFASTIERFHMPTNLCGVVHDKSTWARRGLSVLNTVIESGWNGFLTLELVYHGQDTLHIPAGSGIAQVIFHEIKEPAFYEGKYQGAGDFPQEAIMENSPCA
ncbi:dCTP deaminase [Allorhizobium ampelinum]|uniref:dCTP deaminase n=1 Tax=Allorhizobium ampelinum TaxID=3025782 RepID=UPI000B402C1F|nr:dCTP deaminase [Allorhizobium ampelinum]NTA27456.1 dCTP deaminase [Allorhizobium ampelinum]OVE94512.1 hypothetical protein B7W85_13250 [Allorhizobium ampelinum]